MSTHPYLRDNFAPVTEEVTALDLPVTGTLPPELTGRYLRNGPNPVVEPADLERHHWFVGDGMVHGIRLDDGKASWYRNRWVRSDHVAAALDEPAVTNPLDGDREWFAANTNAIGHAGRTWAIVEGGGVPVELTDELETLGPRDFDGTLPYAFTAHPKRDPASGELHAMAYWWGWGSQVQYMVLGTDGRVRKTVDIATTGPTSVHDTAITETYVVVFDLPVVFSMEAAGEGWPFPYRWDPEYPARVGLQPLGADDDQTKWCDVEPCYVFHPLNAYDTPDGQVVLDLVRHPKMFATDFQGPNEGSPTLDRWTIDPSAGKVIEERLDDTPQEFPRHDERLLGRKSRYGYSVGLGVALEAGSTILKHDLDAGTTTRADLGAGKGVGEPVFVPRTEDAAEDDGWLLTIVHDPDHDTSDLVVLPAEDPASGPIATVALPQRVPFGFHGNWIPDREPPL